MATHPTEAELQGLQALLMRGALAEALPRAEALADAHPDDAPAANILGIALNLTGKGAEAEASFARAVGLDPAYVGAHVNLANQYVLTGRFAQAEPLCRHALEQGPPVENRLKLQILLANSLAGQLRWGEAEGFYRAVLHDRPDDPAAQLGLAKVLAMQLRFVEAWEIAGPAGERWPDEPELARVRARLLIDLNRAEDALTLLEGWRDRMDQNPNLHLVMAAVLRERARDEEARDHCRRAVELMPGDFGAWSELAALENAYGDKAAARTALDRCLALNPDHVPALALRQTIDPALPGSAEYDAAKAAFETPGGDEMAKAGLGIVLFRTHDKRDETDDAFAFLARAKALKARARPYDMAMALKVFDALKTTFAAPDAPFVPAEPAPVRPIFIVGMPRSGTTLVEQILAAHSSVTAGGELPAMGAAMFEQGWNFFKVGAECTVETLAAIRAEYLRFIADFAPDATVITDKTPLNFVWLGFALRALPEAKVLFLSRDPMATCFANYSSILRGRANDFGNTMTDTVTMYRAHLGLKAMWERAFPGRIYTVDYERLTEDQEAESRKLVAAAGLDWEPACLDFHLSDRVVNTASVEQVRQKMYTGSSEKWRRYEAHLGPMLTALEEH